MAYLFKCDNCGYVDPTSNTAHGNVRLVETRNPAGPFGVEPSFLCAFCYRIVRDSLEHALEVAADQHPSRP